MVGASLDARTRRATSVRRSLRSRVSAGHAVMLLAGMLGALFTVAALRSADHRVEVVVARADLVPGTVVTADDLRTVRIAADATAMAGLVPAAQQDALIGRVVTTRIAAGRFVARDDVQLARAGDAGRSMSVPIDRAHALDGQLVAGDRVDVVAADDRTHATHYVATNVEVLRVSGDGARGPLAANDRITVTLAVDADTALDLTAALADKNLTLVRATGAPAIVDAHR
jgi:Flp pilus assembly protein CpaB